MFNAKLLDCVFKRFLIWRCRRETRRTTKIEHRVESKKQQFAKNQDDQVLLALSGSCY